MNGPLPDGFSSFVKIVIGEPDMTSSKIKNIEAARNPKENVTLPEIILTLHSPTVSARKVMLKMHRVLMMHMQAALMHIHISPKEYITHAKVSRTLE